MIIRVLIDNIHPDYRTYVQLGNSLVCTWVYQKVPRLVPQTAKRLHYVNACAVLESRERRHPVCQVASLCEHCELHNTSVCHHVCLHICDFSMDEKLEQRANIKFCVTRQIWSGDF
jgi:hypothetical protein